MASKGTSMNTDIMSMTMSASTMTVPIATRTTANNMMTKNISSNGTVTNKTSSVHVQHINNQNNNTGRQAAIKKSVDEDGDVNLEATQVDDIEEEEEEELEVVANAVLQVANAPQQQSAATATAKQSGVSRIARRSAAANYALLDDVVYDIDIDDHSNCLTASAFAVAAHDNLRRSEECFYICSSSPSQSQQQSPPSSGTTYTTANATISSPPTYPRQSQISDRMRVVLLDWLVDVHHKHRLRSETLFLTVSILDRILHNLPIPRRSFQLVGMVSLWMASKFEDNIPPEVSDLVYVCDGAYSRTDVIREEARLLNVVEFKLNVPTILPFLRRAIKAAAKAGRFENAEIEEDVSCLARYVSEIALFCSKTRGVRPSLVAAAALSVAMGLLKVDLPWGRHMTMHTGWKKCEIVQVEDELVIATREEAAKTGRNSSSQSQGKTHGSQQQHQSDKLSALRRKFNSPRYCHIASRLPGLVLEYDIDTN